MGNRLRIGPVITELAEKVSLYIPFTGSSVIWRALSPGNQSILDVGCGKGGPMRVFNRDKRFFAVGAEIFKQYLIECKSKISHDEYVLCDARRLPFREKSLDVALCIEVLEHLKKEEGLKLIKGMEKVCTEVVICTPVGVYRHEAFDNNPWQEHKSSWYPSELRKLEYEVRMIGLLVVRGERRLPERLKPLGYILCVLAAPLIHFLPKLASHMICIKKCDGLTKTASNMWEACNGSRKGCG